MHAAARRAGAHFLLEAEGAAEKVERGANVAVEEYGMICGGLGVIDIARSPVSLLPQGEGSGMREAMAATC